jgi:DNA-binding transcriptional MerR regulator
MKQLNEAYDNKNIEKVKEILASLENGTSFDVASDKIDDKKILKNKIKEFREKISVIEQELDRINEDETFQTIENIEDMDNYFERLKEELEEEYEALNGRVE